MEAHFLTTLGNHTYINSEMKNIFSRRLKKNRISQDHEKHLVKSSLCQRTEAKNKEKNTQQQTEKVLQSNLKCFHINTK